MSKTYYITTPIYYVNDIPHLGHAYCTTAADVLARFYRLDGYDVKFLTGVDEHGQKVQKAAETKGMDPQTYVDQVSQSFRDLAKILNISNDDFIRTTEPRHKAAVQALWKKLVENDAIYLGKYSGWYAVRDEAFYAESELTTTPDGKKISPYGAECEWTEEDTYFFRLSAWQDKLLQHYENNPDFITPASRRNEVVSFVKGGLEDLSVSRTSLTWGVPVPDAPKHVMYVWIDALTNYISALGYPDASGDFGKYWPNVVHLIGKEIVRFHAVYWPAFLMAAGIEPPKKVFGHGWWTAEGQKMSKSIGNVINPLELINTFGLDATRYYMMRAVPFGNDGDFSRADMIARINSNLANDYGNLVQRVLTQINKNCDAKVPSHGVFTPEDEAMLGAARDLLPLCRAEAEQQAIHKMLDAIWQVIGKANQYVDAQAPWALKKTDKDRMNTVLYVLAETIRHVGIFTQPFMPESSAKVLDLLAQTDRSFAALATPLAVGLDLPAPSPVFPRYVEEGA